MICVWGVIREGWDFSSHPFHLDPLDSTILELERDRDGEDIEKRVRERDGEYKERRESKRKEDEYEKVKGVKMNMRR